MSAHNPSITRRFVSRIRLIANLVQTLLSEDGGLARQKLRAAGFSRSALINCLTWSRDMTRYRNRRADSIQWVKKHLSEELAAEKAAFKANTLTPSIHPDYQLLATADCKISEASLHQFIQQAIGHNADIAYADDLVSQASGVNPALKPQFSISLFDEENFLGPLLLINNRLLGEWQLLEHAPTQTQYRELIVESWRNGACIIRALNVWCWPGEPGYQWR